MTDENTGGEDTGQQGDTGVIERPEWLPEKFWTPEGPSVENLAKSYTELEKMRGKSADDLKAEWEAERRSGLPEAPDQYALPENDALDPDALAASPVVSVFREIAHKAGIGQEQFAEAINAYAEAEVVRAQEQHARELAALGENGKARAEAVGLWARKTFGEGAKFDAVAQVCTTAAGVEAIEQIMGALRDGGGDTSAFEGMQTSGDTEADIRALMNSRAYYDPKQRDPAVVARVEAFYQKQYGKR